MVAPLLPSAIRLRRAKKFVEAEQCRSRFAVVKLNAEVTSEGAPGYCQVSP
jgi:hypothetical protein